MTDLIANTHFLSDNLSGGVQRSRARFSGRLFISLASDSAVTVTYASFDDDDFGRGTYTDLSLELTGSEFRNSVARCLTAWESAISDCTTKLRGRTRRPYDDDCHHNPDSEYVQKLGAKLAVAGLDLFNSLLAQRGPINAGLTDSLTDYVRRAIAHRKAGKPTPERLKISTPKPGAPMAPWQLLYTHPTGALADDGSNFDWEGFWGCNIVVDQEPGSHHGSIVLDAVKSLKLSASVSFDENIDRQFSGDYVRRQLTWFDGLGSVDVARRNTREVLAAALQSVESADHIFYFYCHGHSLNEYEAALFLTDNEPITPADLRRWLLSCSRDGFSPSPIVFINACKGGRLSIDAVNTVAREWLSLGAAGVVGPVIDVPATFAATFALDFFSDFLRASDGDHYAGDVLLELTRACVLEHGNPLAMAYSMYRAAECFVRWP